MSWYGAEGNAFDSVSGNNGTLVGGAGFAAGKSGQAFNINGVDSAVRVKDAPSLEPATITVEVWVNSANVGPHVCLLSKGANSGSFGSYAFDTASSPNADLYFDVAVGGSCSDRSWQRTRRCSMATGTKSWEPLTAR